MLEASNRNEVAVPAVASFFDETTSTITYVVSDVETGVCAVIDPVLDYDPKAGRTGADSASKVIGYVNGAGLRVEWILETHAHADHLSATPYLKSAFSGSLSGICAHIIEVQSTFKRIFNLADEFVPDGSQFDHLFHDGETFKIGGIEASVLHTPGHTPACASYLVGDSAFVGDTLFMPDYGTARADFPGGNARTLYRSIQKLLALPSATRLFLCHDYQPGGRKLAWEVTVAEQITNNIHLRDGITEDEFVQLREARDRTLDMPNLIIPAIQVNINGGQWPEPEDNGVVYLKIPIDQF